MPSPLASDQSQTDPLAAQNAGLAKPYGGWGEFLDWMGVYPLSSPPLGAANELEQALLGKSPGERRRETLRSRQLPQELQAAPPLNPQRQLEQQLQSRFNPISYQEQQQAPADDYDFQAAQAAGVRPDERGHWPDTYKRPNHITFSDESIYHGQDGNQGGRWEQKNGVWHFTPGPTNLQHHTPEQLREYFRQYEPDVVLHLEPMSFRQPPSMAIPLDPGIGESANLPEPPPGVNPWEPFVPLAGSPVPPGAEPVIDEWLPPQTNDPVLTPGEMMYWNYYMRSQSGVQGT